MAKWILCNRAILPDGIIYRPGREFDDVITPLQPVLDVGGVFLALPNAAAEAIALQMRTRQGHGWTDEEAEAYLLSYAKPNNATLLQGLPISITPGTPGQVLTTSGALASWQTPANAGDATSIQGEPVNATPPIAGQVLEYDGAQYIPTTPSGGGGDATSIQGVAVSATDPTLSGSVPAYDGSSLYVPRRLTLDDIDPAFGITGFSGGNIIKEIGDSIASPVVFSASYTSTPTLASIVDDQGNASLPLISPFTVGSYAHAYTKTTNNATVVWTLSATGATVKTSTNTARWRPRIYYGAAIPPVLYDQASLLALAHAMASQPLNANNSLTVNYAATAGKKCYFISPTSFGTATAQYLGFPFAASVVATFTDTNGFGVSQTYNVVESNLASLGTLNGVAWS